MCQSLINPASFVTADMILDAVVEHIDDEKHMLRTTVICYDGDRSKQIAVGRAMFNRYTPKLGMIDNIRPAFRMLWDIKSLNFIGKAILNCYQSLSMFLHKRKFKKIQEKLPKFSIQEEREKNSHTLIGTGDTELFNGMTEEEFIVMAETEPVFGDKVLGLRVLSLAPGLITTAMPYKDYFTGNFVTAALHGGVMAGLVDQTAGMCARSVVRDKEQRVSTVNFSIDYLAPAKCFEHMVCEARVVSGQSDPDDSSSSGGGNSREELIFVDATCWNECKTKVIGVAKLTFNVYNRKR
jgi:uncharacterized protein (TIGR00369 family)